MVVVPVIVAVGKAIVTIALPDCGWLQTDEPEDVTLTKA
jgi:hypothetical protein